MRIPGCLVEPCFVDKERGGCRHFCDNPASSLVVGDSQVEIEIAKIWKAAYHAAGKDQRTRFAGALGNKATNNVSQRTCPTGALVLAGRVSSVQE